ncbi:putative lysosomal cobalamin transporter [Blomia tropicalis]|nr:putative lysosomal cobalamin transporter [Blomia tropicalis]
MFSFNLTVAQSLGMPNIPSGSIISIIATFVVALAFIILFSIYYVRKYTNPNDSDRCTTATAVLSFVTALLTCSLLPIDIFIASSMKYSNGTFKEWAINGTIREHFENQVLYSYYTLYSLILLFTFLIIPFMYFFFEEKDSDLFDSNRTITALKYTLIFVLMAAFFLMIGAFVPLRQIPNNNGNSTNNNSSWIDKFKNLIDVLEKNRGQDALSMVLSILTAIGVTNVAIYTAIGMFSWPIGFIKGTKSAREQIQDLEERHLNNMFNINSLREKERTCGHLTEKERRRLARLEDQERMNTLEEQYVNSYRNTIFYQLRYLMRPIQIIFGVFVLIISILIWISLLITNVDKAFHSLGMTMGYALPNATYPNPIDIVLVKLQTIYPLDYIMIIIFTFVLVMYTISGYISLGIRLFVFKMYKIVPSKTAPQAILILFAMLMSAILGINILFYSTFPQYVTYGNQHFVQSINGTNHTAIFRCTISASSDECTMTRMSALLVQFFYKAWYFGAYYYWAMWAFLAISFVSLVYVIIKPKQVVTEGLLDDDEFEEED